MAALGDSTILLEFDPQMRSRLWHLRAGGPAAGQVALTRWAASEYLLLGDGRRVELFTLQQQGTDRVTGLHGPGRCLRMTGVSATGIEKNLEIQLFERYPGIAFYRVSYRNRSAGAIALRAWSSADLHLLGDAAARAGTAGPHFWSYCGSTHAGPTRLGATGGAGIRAGQLHGHDGLRLRWRYSDGRPVATRLRTCRGAPRVDSPAALPAGQLPRRLVQISLSVPRSSARLKPGEALVTPEVFVATHTGDYFATLDAYRRIMSDRGLKSPPVPQAAYEPIWCAWGYERDCTVQLIEDTLPKVQDLGLRWAVIDDGWQSNVGDWKLSPAKFPRGEADMTHLLQSIRARALMPRLWFAPLAAAPGSDLLHDHTDMLLLDKEGAAQNVSWWNSFYLCPAYEKTVTYTEGLVRTFMRDWGFAGLKIDGQHLNAVAPCFNPAHRHARPEESVEKLQDFMHAIYRTATQINPEAVIEWCPCGTSYSFYNFSSMNQAPASDPESSWQVRHKGKTLKALMGPSAAFAGDHVELSDGGDDFASTVGVGAIVSTKFTWPRDPKPKDSFLLTPQREAAVAQMDRALQRANVAGWHLSRRAL